LRGLQLHPAISICPVVLLALLITLPGAAFSEGVAATAPQDSHPKSYGHGWECDRGYREAAGACVAVKIPANGHLVDYSYGHGWECDRGYREAGEAGQACVAIKVPANAHSADSFYGRSGWECDRSYREVSGTCIAVTVPDNGYRADSSFGRGWECERGFRAVSDACVAVNVPENAYLQHDGSTWTCERGLLRTVFSAASESASGFCLIFASPWATMSQKPSLPQLPNSVQLILTGNSPLFDALRTLAVAKRTSMAPRSASGM
jgi:hypothetical protein